MQEAEEAEQRAAASNKHQHLPQSNYKDKYQHLIGTVAAKDAAEATTANRSYGFGTFVILFILLKKQVG